VSVLIRRENERDGDAVAAVTAAAFGGDANAGLPPEVTLVSRLRADDATYRRCRWLRWTTAR
jgi:hypothetical protein